jgi:phosphoenolpyruvate---glycerone phosphotransferase subunit DhaM
MPSVTSNEQYVGLVLVSHSRELAAGLAQLVGQVAGENVTVRPAGGMPDGSLGTNGGEVLDVLREAANGNGAGAVVLMDLGSSVLAVRAALEELEPGDLQRIAVADAPFVEGAVAAGVTASIGASLEEVATAAKEARGVYKL